MDNILICDLLYVVNDKDFYMDAYDINTSKNIKLKLTKDSVGLSNVANRAFADYVYEDFGQTMKTNLETKFLDRPTWNKLFADWAPPTADKNTPQKWLTKLDAEDQSIWDSIHSLKLFLGYFQTVK